MKLLALDQATRTTGYAVFNDGVPVVINHFTITKDDFAERLVEIRNTVIKLIEEYDIDTVAFEDIQLQENTKTFKVLAEVFGIIYELVTVFFSCCKDIHYNNIHQQIVFIGRQRFSMHGEFAAELE